MSLACMILYTRREIEGKLALTTGQSSPNSITTKAGTPRDTKEPFQIPMSISQVYFALLRRNLTITHTRVVDTTILNTMFVRQKHIHRRFHTTPHHRSLSPPENLLQSVSSFTYTAPSSTSLPSFKLGDPKPMDQPLASYLQISLTPSLPLSPLSPSALRKLLILDLNGTLLVRSPHSHPHGGENSRGVLAQDNIISTSASRETNSRSRHVYPRPFMPSFRAYLSAPQTLEWLDTMVWSSAQPHNVENMVDKCFGDDRNNLVAVWARDRLGLGRDEYHRKTQTTKDLTKPWLSLALRSSASLGSQSSRKNLDEQPQTHSALTTILLDDSPLKAQLQPWNHLCIPEYVRKTRQRDLQVMNNERSNERKEHPQSSTSPPKKRKRKRPESPTDSFSSSEIADKLDTYDETLLAVIGILDAIKNESNVAGWIRAGGLWGKHAQRNDMETSSKTQGDAKRMRMLTAEESGSLLGNGAVQHDRRNPTLPSEMKEGVHPMWFENRDTMENWATRGRNTLSTLGIEIDAGVKG